MLNISQDIPLFTGVSEWLVGYGGAKSMVLPRGLSDHCPIVFEMKRIKWRPRPFRLLH